MIAAAVVNQARQGVARGGEAAALGTSFLRARAAIESLVLCGARSGLLGGGRLVARVADLATAHGGVRFVQHAICSDS